MLYYMGVELQSNAVPSYSQWSSLILNMKIILQHLRNNAPDNTVSQSRRNEFSATLIQKPHSSSNNLLLNANTSDNHTTMQ
jgi:hypothetical protein